MREGMEHIHNTKSQADAKGKQHCGQSGNRGTLHRKAATRHTYGWEPPPPGWTKINVDGSFTVNNDGVGIVARNSSGETLFTAWRVLFRCANAAETEARACAQGLHLVAQWAQGPVLIESDCARVVKALQRKEDWSELSFVIAEAREQAQLLEKWKIVQVRRECNQVATELAKLARQNTHTAVWIRQAPACVLDLLQNDCKHSLIV